MSNPDITRIDVNSRIADAVIFNNVVYLAGQVPRSTLGQSVKEQTTDVLEQIDRALAKAGSDKSRLLSVQIFMKDITQNAGMNEAWEEWIPKGHCPARATLEAKMNNDQWALEIVVTAALK